jgi:carbon storage regulator
MVCQQGLRFFLWLIAYRTYPGIPGKVASVKESTRRKKRLLVFMRSEGESLYIGGMDARVMVVGIRGQQVRLGIRAPKHVSVARPEVRMSKLAQPMEPSIPAGPRTLRLREATQEQVAPRLDPDALSIAGTRCEENG